MGVPATTRTEIGKALLRLYAGEASKVVIGMLDGGEVSTKPHWFESVSNSHQKRTDKNTLEKEKEIGKDVAQWMNKYIRNID